MLRRNAAKAAGDEAVPGPILVWNGLVTQIRPVGVEAENAPGLDVVRPLQDEQQSSRQRTQASASATAGRRPMTEAEGPERAVLPVGPGYR